MQKNIISDGTYIFIYKLPSNTVLEFDFSLKKEENFESILYENFEQEKIPKILLQDINILMKHSDYANFEILTSNICYFITKCFAIFLREIWQNVLKREIFSLQNMKK